MNALEVYIDRAAASLKAGMPAKVAALNLEPGAPVLPAPGDDRYLFGGEESGAIASYPAVEIAAPNRAHAAFAISQAGWDTQPVVVVRGWLAYDHNIHTYQGLYRGVLRFGRALLEVLLLPDAFGPGVVVSNVQEVHRTADPQTNERQDLDAFALLIFTLQDIEG